jgi:outer membrane lipoprotein SlyB
MRKLLACLLLAVPLSAVAMGNEDVIKMVKGGLSESTVLQVIGSAEPGFDTSADGLIKLKQGGVSDKIIQQVIARQAAAPAAAATPGLAPLPAQTAPVQPAAGAAPPPPQTCPDCGTIANIKEVKKKGTSSGMGAVTGALIGGGLGYAVGGSGHRTAGTLIGAGGGALAGNYIEKSASAGKTFKIEVRFDNGTTQTFHYDSHPSWNIGSRVKLVNGQLMTLLPPAADQSPK